MQRVLELSEKKYFSSLDGLRGIAVLCVLYQHMVLNKGMVAYLSLGYAGVGLFFVLSGFLIGTILIKERFKKDLGLTTTKRSIKKFYIRRSLRIFPIYYLILILLLLIGIPNTIYEDIYWYVSYTTNIRIVIEKHFFWPCSHFWTLAIEEQFYLIFPLLLFIIPSKHVLKLILGFISIGILSRFVLYFAGDYHYQLFTFCQFDFFGIGLFLAYLVINKKELFNNGYALLLAVAAYLFFLLPILSFKGKSLLLTVLPLLHISFFLLIQRSITIWSSSRFLNSKVLRYTGKISYGMYLYHPFISMLREYLIEISNTSIALIVDLILIYILASLSFYLIEKPINNLKDKYAY
jgi:peptidoglycan/LPS O-acetylase OafA/YrhL